MMEEIVIPAELRTVIGKQTKALRRTGRLPGILYGGHIEPTPISLDMHSASLILPTITSSQFIIIDLGKEKHSVLVRERQRHPVRGELIHVDFQVISMTERLRTEVRITLEGDAPVVKAGDGVMVTGIEVIEVECLPKNLPERIFVDLSILKEIGDAIYVRDLNLGNEIDILTDEEEMLVLVTAPTAEPEVEEELLEEELEGEPEVIDRGKHEEEEEEG
jgi:large subunit ribosomal protein L25